MASKSANDTHYTLQIRALLKKVSGRSMLKDSFIERAISYYQSQCVIKQKKSTFSDEIASLTESANHASGKELSVIEKNITRITREQRTYNDQVGIEREERHTHLRDICLEIISLCEGGNFEESNRKSAKILGTIQLFSPAEGSKVAVINEQHKPIYKAILCLRLLDRLCLDKNIVDPYIRTYLGDISPEKYEAFAELEPEQYDAFLMQVKLPLVMAALIQDIGNFHPDAQLILKGEGDLDPFRMLDVEERKKLLQINYRETVSYLAEGIGPQKYTGNSKVERDKFIPKEHKKMLFIKQLLKSSINPKEGLGNLLKVPQIYTSIILSTKENYNYKLLPKVYQALNLNADRGNCSQVVVDALYKITGDFPQGYGVIYIPKDSGGKACERYEYAIVNQFYPDVAEHPICRNATRNLTFISHGTDIEVVKESNLYFPGTVKQFSSISKERLNEILELLSSNYHERKQLDLVPRCWYTSEFFSQKKNQNIWNRNK